MAGVANSNERGYKMPENTALIIIEYGSVIIGQRFFL
jgi:hypothetical protein